MNAFWQRVAFLGEREGIDFVLGSFDDWAARKQWHMLDAMGESYDPACFSTSVSLAVLHCLSLYRDSMSAYAEIYERIRAALVADSVDRIDELLEGF